MTATVTHDADITVNVTMDSAAPQVAGFGALMLVVAKATNSLITARTMTFTATSDVTAAKTAGYISAATQALLNACFAQSPPPATVKAGNIDLVGLETYPAAIAAIQAVDDDWYVLAIASRVSADIVAAAGFIESLEKLFAFQSGDSSWLDSGVPAGFSTIVTYERSIGYYHDTSTEALAEGAAANRLVYDPDSDSAPWNGYDVGGVAVYATGLTSTQRGFGIGNYINLSLPFGGGTMVIDPGVNIKGRPVYEVLTRDWFAARLRERISALIVNRGNAGLKMPMTPAGQALVLSVVKGLLSEGQAAGHFVPGASGVFAQAETITTTDYSLRRLRFSGWAQYATSARLFTFTVNLGRDALTVGV